MIVPVGDVGDRRRLPLLTLEPRFVAQAGPLLVPLASLHAALGLIRTESQLDHRRKEGV